MMGRGTLADLEIEQLIKKKVDLDLALIDAQYEDISSVIDRVRNKLDYINTRIYRLTGQDLRVP